MKTTRTVKATREVEVVSVTALPDEVSVEIRADDGILTSAQARELSKLLSDAADQSADLDWVEKDGDYFVEKKETER